VRPLRVVLAVVLSSAITIMTAGCSRDQTKPPPQDGPGPTATNGGGMPQPGGSGPNQENTRATEPTDTK
jgi:hypothetical protein